MLGIEQMKGEARRQLLEHLDPADAVAVLVQTGENVANPPTAGSTPRMPPPTPLLAGRPTVNTHSPP
jgi:hypothetical protein